MGLGNTSMHMEKIQKREQDHRRARETPPCTWRKWMITIKNRFSSRNTSMHMEKIEITPLHRASSRKHLHAHGENL